MAGLYAYLLERSRLPAAHLPRELVSERQHPHPAAPELLWPEALRGAKRLGSNMPVGAFFRAVLLAGVHLFSSLLMVFSWCFSCLFHSF